MSTSIEKRNADFKQAVFAKNGESFDVGNMVKIISAIEHAAAFALAEKAFKTKFFTPEHAIMVRHAGRGFVQPQADFIVKGDDPALPFVKCIPSIKTKLMGGGVESAQFFGGGKVEKFL